MTCLGCKDRAKGACNVSVGHRRGEPVLTASGNDFEVQSIDAAAGARAEGGDTMSKWEYARAEWRKWGVKGDLKDWGRALAELQGGWDEFWEEQDFDIRRWYDRHGYEDVSDEDVNDEEEGPSEGAEKLSGGAEKSLGGSGEGVGVEESGVTRRSWWEVDEADRDDVRARKRTRVASPVRGVGTGSESETDAVQRRLIRKCILYYQLCYRVSELSYLKNGS